MRIRPATDADWPAIWAMLAPVFRAGETYAVDRDITERAARHLWTDTPRAVYLAEDDAGTPLGTYYIKTNAAGGGAHVCNCGYVTAAAAQGKGVATAMCRQSQDAARELGYAAMQFNLVLSSNSRAIALWQREGFDIVGTLPGVFDHPRLGRIDAHVMLKWLEPG